MAAVIPTKRWVVLASFILIFVIKKQQAISGTSAATYKVMEPHLKVVFWVRDHVGDSALGRLVPNKNKLGCFLLGTFSSSPCYLLSLTSNCCLSNMRKI